jgi:PAS domain S-box-containing protein
VNRADYLRSISIPFIVFLLFFAFTANAAAADKKVLFIVDAKSTGAVAGYGNLIASELTTASTDRIDFYEEYTDFWEFSGESYKELLHEFYRQKYHDRKFDLIIAQSPGVLSFLLNYGDELFPATPIVFGTTEKTRFESIRSSLKPNFTGVLFDLNFAATVDLARRIQPDLRKMVVISGSADIDSKYLARARTQLLEFEGRLEMVYWTGLPMQEIEKRLAALPAQSAILYLTINQDGLGESFTPTEALARIANAAQSPTYVMADRFIGGGALGGFVVSLDDEAREVAKLAGRVLAGKNPAEIPVRVADTNRYELDWRQLNRWGIEERNLPPDVVLHFKSPSFWQQYKWSIAAIATITILQTLLIVGLLISRSRRRRAEEVRNRLAAIVEFSEDAILTKDLNGRITAWNEGATKMYGYSAAEVIGKSISILTPPDLQDEPSEILARIRLREGVLQMETVRVTKAGRQIDISLTVSPLKDRNGNPIGASVIARDITDRKRADGLRRESEERFQMLADTAPVMIWVSGSDALCTFFNRQWLEFTGRTMEQEIGNGWSEGVHPADFQPCIDYYRSSFDARRTYTMEYRLKRADGQYRWLVANGIPRFGAKGDFLGYIGTCVDISEHKQNEHALQHLTARLFTLQDEERQRVAAELHDGLGQSLAIIKNRAHLGLRSQENPERIIEQLEEIAATATAAILEVREIAHNLRPYELDRLGLGAAIESMVERISNSTPISLSADLEGMEDLLSPEAETSVYRIVQEALSNVIQHSKATAARIVIRTCEGKMTISIQDNGTGFPVSAGNGSNARGFGLAGIAERVRGLGGFFEIVSKPEGGTTLTVHLESNDVKAE